MTTLYTAHPAASASAPAPHPSFPLPKAVIALVCVVVPIWGSTILYFMWRNTHPEAARYANRLGWMVFGGVALLAVVAGAVGMRAGKARQVGPGVEQPAKAGRK